MGTGVRHHERPRVALIIESSRAYGRCLLLGVARFLREQGRWSVFLQERSLGDVSPGWLKDWEGDGIIARIENEEMADVIHRIGVPAVDLRNLLPNLGMPCVRNDDLKLANVAAEHLLERGFRQYAYCGFDGADYSDTRKHAFANRITNAGFPCHVFEDPQRPVNATTLEYEEHGLRYEGLVGSWIQNLPKPVGLMACNDIRGQQLLNACRVMGVAVPDEVAVIGVDNDEVLCDLSDPPLSSVVPNAERIGYEAAALLDRMMAGSKPPQRPLLIEPSGIVTRRSTDVLAIDDEHVASAVRFVREHACEGIGVSDILKAAPLSRSTLERRFVKVLGRSPKGEILRVQLDHAKRLLAETDVTLANIAEQVGFEHAEYFSVIFRKKTGLTPGQFRTRSRIAGTMDRPVTRTGTVAFLTSSESLKTLSQSPIMADVLHGIEDALASAGMSLVQGAVGAKRALPPLVAKGGVDGVIVWPHLYDVSAEAIEILRGYKIVHVMSGASERLSADRVRPNHGMVGRLAAKYLSNKGHRNLAYLTPSSLISHVNLCDRWAAFSALADEHGLKARQCVIEQSHLDLLELDMDRDALIHQTLEEFLAQDEHPDGMFVTCDALTAKIYPILKSMGIRVGVDLEVISCNNEVSLLAGLEPRPLSIDIQPYYIGKTAVEQLRWRIVHPQEESQVTIEVSPKSLG